MRKILALSFLLVSAPLWAQKQVLPALRALEKSAAQLTGYAALKNTGWIKNAARLSLPLRYAAPATVSLQTLERLSGEIDRLVRLSRPGAGTLRSLDALKEFVTASAPARLRAQAAALARLEFTPEEARLFLDFYPFLTTPTRFSLENNQWILNAAPAFKKQAAYVKSHREEITSALKISELDAPGQLVSAIGPEARLIMLGEVHGRASQRRQIVALLKAYRAQYPGRKMVLFSEFLPDKHPRYWQPGQAVPADFFETNPAFSNEVYELGRLLDMEIYGLEDLQYTYQKFGEMSGLEFAVANTSFRAMPVRNKYWEGIIRFAMEKTRRTDPDAVFFVYAGNMHINKSVMESLPVMLKDENPVSVEFRNGFQNGFLGFLLGKDPGRLAEVPRPYLARWGNGKNYSKALGFDVQVLVPFEEADISVPAAK